MKTRLYKHIEASLEQASYSDVGILFNRDDKLTLTVVLIFAYHTPIGKSLWLIQRRDNFFEEWKAALLCWLEYELRPADFQDKFNPSQLIELFVEEE